MTTYPSSLLPAPALTDEVTLDAALDCLLGAMFICGVWGKEKKGRILLDNKKKDQTGIHHE
jgi:hypothetical protein